MNRNTPNFATHDTTQVNLLEMFRLVPIDPNEVDDYDSDDDVLCLAPPIGRDEVLRRLSTAPWLGDHLRSCWPAGSVSPYINSYAALARIATTSAVLQSTHPEDIAYALSLPLTFCYVAAVLLNLAPPLESRAKLKTADPATSPEVLKNLITEYLMECLSSRLRVVDVLKGVGPSLYHAIHTA